MKKEKVAMYKNIIVWLAVIAAAIIIMNPGSPVSMEVLEDEIVVSGNSGYTVRIVYAEIQDVELRERVDYGIMINGQDGQKEKSGAWKNEEFGEYQLCVDARVDSCILLHMESGIRVINMESEQFTAGLYEAILDRIDNGEKAE